MDTYLTQAVIKNYPETLQIVEVENIRNDCQALEAIWCKHTENLLRRLTDIICDYAADFFIEASTALHSCPPEYTQYLIATISKDFSMRQYDENFTHQLLYSAVGEVLDAQQIVQETAV